MHSCGKSWLVGTGTGTGSGSRWARRESEQKKSFYSKNYTHQLLHVHHVENRRRGHKRIIDNLKIYGIRFT